MEKILNDICTLLKELDLEYSESYVKNGRVFYVDAKDDIMKIKFSKTYEKGKVEEAVKEICDLLERCGYNCKSTVKSITKIITGAEIVGTLDKKEKENEKV